jgi:uncharacterized protein involved in exopolysaccharide biosynthesis
VHGSQDFELVEFVEYLYVRRSAFLIACGVAVGLTLAIGLFLPKQYTAKSSLVIEPPASDPRAGTVLSPAYLESLKSWESFAGSDTLFARASRKLQVRESKASVLRITRPTGSTVVEINVTLHDPAKAQALAQNLAEQAVDLSRSIESKSAGDLAGELKKQLEAAQERLTRATQSLAAFAGANPDAAAENDIRSGFDFRLRLSQDLSSARTSLAELQAQKNAPAGQLSGLQTRIQALESQQRDLVAELEKKGVAVDAAKARRAALEDEQRAARASYEQLRTRLNDALASSQYGRTRIEIIDPGVVPRQPTFPNRRLNLIAAFLASFIATLACFVVRFGYVRLQRERSERLYSLQ